MPSTTENSTGFKTFQATAAAIAVGARVKADNTGKISVAAAAEAAIGVVTEAVAASGWGTVKLFGAPGTFLMIASGVINAATQVYPAASGKIAGSGTTALNLQALEAAAADGDLIECAPILKGA
jgi:hypothetical protein